MLVLEFLNFSFLVLAHKKKAAQARVRSIQKSEESKKKKKEEEREETESTVTEVVTSPVESAENMQAAIHKEEVLFVKRVFPHIISLSEEDLGLNL